MRNDAVASLGHDAVASVGYAAIAAVGHDALAGRATVSRLGRLASVLALGVAAVAADRALRERYHADSLSQALGAAAAELAEVAALVRHGMSEREGELRVALGLDAPPGGAPVDPTTTRALLDDPARWQAPTSTDRS